MPVASVIFLSATGVFSVLLHALVISNPAIKMDANKRMYEFLTLTVQSIFNPDITDFMWNQFRIQTSFWWIKRRPWWIFFSQETNLLHLFRIKKS